VTHPPPRHHAGRPGTAMFLECNRRKFAYSGDDVLDSTTARKHEESRRPKPLKLRRHLDHADVRGFVEPRMRRILALLKTLEGLGNRGRHVGLIDSGKELATVAGPVPFVVAPDKF